MQVWGDNSEHIQKNNSGRQDGRKVVYCFNAFIGEDNARALNIEEDLSPPHPHPPEI